MPHKSWVHNCKNHDNNQVILGVEVCDSCGAHGTFNGWGLSMIESMGAYQKRYNLRAIGPHRKMTDELFKGRMNKCDQCNGEGVVGTIDDDRGEICPKCQRKQYTFDGSSEEFESLRQKIIAIYPSAEPGSPLPEKSESPQSADGYVGGGFFKPADNSLQAYKDFAMGLLKAINPNFEEDSSIKSDEEWEESWKKTMSKSKPKE